jgi:protein involved in polysaccharide export with SLBB domain
VGDLKVDNMELEDIEDLINEAYVPKVYKEASVFVSIASVESTEVIVKGAVTNPGLIPLRRTERNVLFALVSAGGLTEAASGIITLQRLRLAGSLATLNMSTPEGIKQALMEEPLEDGDIINVHGWDMPDIIVSGLIKLSGNATMSRITLPPGKRCKSVLQVLAEAGGLPSTLFIREGTLTRWYPDGRNVRVRLDLLRLVSGKDPNFMLQAGDILWVNHTFDTWVQQWFNSHVMLNAGASANMSYNATATDQLNHRDTATGAGTPTSGFDPFGFLQRGFLLNQPTTP